MAAEKNLEDALRLRIKMVGGWVGKIHGNEFQSGYPDLFVCYKGRFIALEVKAPGGYPTELQLKRLREFRAAGGIGEVIYNMDLLNDIIECVDRGEVWQERALPSCKTPLKMDRPSRKAG